MEEETKKEKKKNYSEKKWRKKILKDLHKKLDGLDPSSETYKDVLEAIKVLESVRKDERWWKDLEVWKLLAKVFGTCGSIWIIYKLEKDGHMILPPKLMNQIKSFF